MQIRRTILKLMALAGVVLALTIGGASVASAQEECNPGYEGVEGYEGYEGYEGCPEDDNGTGGDGGTTTPPPPPAPAPAGTSSLPQTGGIALLGLGGAAAALGLAMRRLRSSV